MRLERNTFAGMPSGDLGLHGLERRMYIGHPAEIFSSKRPLPRLLRHSQEEIDLLPGQSFLQPS